MSTLDYHWQYRQSQHYSTLHQGQKQELCSQMSKHTSTSYIHQSQHRPRPRTHLVILLQPQKEGRPLSKKEGPHVNTVYIHQNLPSPRLRRHLIILNLKEEFEWGYAQSCCVVWMQPLMCFSHCNSAQIESIIMRTGSDTSMVLEEDIRSGFLRASVAHKI